MKTPPQSEAAIQQQIVSASTIAQTFLRGRARSGAGIKRAWTEEHDTDIPDILRQLFSYDPESGLISRRISRSGRNSRAGTIAGNLRADGYYQISLFGRLTLSHRVAWLLFYGTWPKGEVDHINLVRSDNRIANLRIATHGQNQSNCAPYRSNKLGVKGVHRHATKFIAGIRSDGKNLYLGTYTTLEEADAVYRSAAKKYHGEFARFDASADIGAE